MPQQPLLMLLWAWQSGHTSGPERVFSFLGIGLLWCLRGDSLVRGSRADWTRKLEHQCPQIWQLLLPTMLAFEPHLSHDVCSRVSLCGLHPYLLGAPQQTKPGFVDCR